MRKDSLSWVLDCSYITKTNVLSINADCGSDDEGDEDSGFLDEEWDDGQTSQSSKCVADLPSPT